MYDCLWELSFGYEFSLVDVSAYRSSHEQLNCYYLAGVVMNISWVINSTLEVE